MFRSITFLLVVLAATPALAEREVSFEEQAVRRAFLDHDLVNSNSPESLEKVIPEFKMDEWFTIYNKDRVKELKRRLVKLRESVADDGAFQRALRSLYRDVLTQSSNSLKNAKGEISETRSVDYHLFHHGKDFVSDETIKEFNKEMDRLRYFAHLEAGTQLKMMEVYLHAMNTGKAPALWAEPRKKKEENARSSNHR